jgi:tetratricopeptide (TPR) repeat protein
LQNLDWYAGFYLVAIQGRFDEGIAVAKEAVEYDPLSVYARVILAQMYTQAGRSTEALVAADSARELEESFFAYWSLQGAFYSDRQFAKAAEAGELALALSGRHVFALGPQAVIFADWGKLAEAKAIYAELVARAAQGYILPTHMAMAASAAGELDKAMAHAREAFEVRDPVLVVGRRWPTFVRLREDPRFTEILGRMGLK